MTWDCFPGIQVFQNDNKKRKMAQIGSFKFSMQTFKVCYPPLNTNKKYAKNETPKLNEKTYDSLVGSLI